MKARSAVAVLGCVVATNAACSRCSAKEAAPTRPQIELALWHTFNPEETATLNQVLEGIGRQHPDWRVRPTVIPFAHAQNAFRRAIADCRTGAPDVFRAELPWLAEFVSRNLLLPVGDDPLLPHESRYIDPARAMARYRARRWALPASIDFLALLYNRELVNRPPSSVDQLVSIAREVTVDDHNRRPADPGFDAQRIKRWGFYVRADGYWFLPFLHAEGGAMLDPHAAEILIDRPQAIRALERYRDLVVRDHVAPRPSPSNDYEDQLQRFGRAEVAMIVNGPWAIGALLAQPAFGGRDGAAKLGVAPFPRGREPRPAPLSGHGYVVSRCSKHPRAAWRLAAALSSPDAQGRFARRNLLIPTLSAAQPPPTRPQRRLFRELQRAMAAARPRPQHPAMARIFDDFNPAVQAVVLGEATADEALAAVAAAWRRLLGQP